jgi:glycosyltransferase involved in cell wall biosynthesis
VPTLSGPTVSGPTRIAFCITDLDAGGAERAMVQLVKGLDRARWEPFVFCLSGPGELTGVLRDAGIMVACLGANKPRHVGVVWRLARRFKKLRPAIVQTYLYHANITGRLAAKAAGVPHIVSGIRVAEKRSRLRLWLDHATGWMVERHVCVSRDVATFSAGPGRLPAAKIAVIPNGVDAAQLAAATPIDLAQFGIPAGSRTLLYVGRLDPQKGPFLLLLSVKELLSVYSDLHVLFVGDGVLKETLRAWVQREGLQSRIHFAGRRNDVPSLLRSADLFVLPSAWEGLPNVLLEAMAAGTPVIATAVEGVSDLLIDHETGLVVPPNSPRDLAGAITVLLANSAQAKKMAEAAQRFVADQFTWQGMVAQYNQLYEKLVENGKFP